MPKFGLEFNQPFSRKLLSDAVLLLMFSSLSLSLARTVPIFYLFEQKKVVVMSLFADVSVFAYFFVCKPCKFHLISEKLYFYFPSAPTSTFHAIFSSLVLTSATFAANPHSRQAKARQSQIFPQCNQTPIVNESQLKKCTRDSNKSVEGVLRLLIPRRLYAFTRGPSYFPIWFWITE